MPEFTLADLFTHLDPEGADAVISAVKANREMYTNCLDEEAGPAVEEQIARYDRLIAECEALRESQHGLVA